MNNYKHVFFDLDRTLWDLETNSRFALYEIYTDLKLTQLGVSDFDLFFQNYRKINDRLWDEYRRGIIEKESLRYQRFVEALIFWGIDDISLAEKMGDAYINSAPKRTALIANTLTVLDYLKPKYQLHIITNGFDEVQHLKMETSGLKPYFSAIITSENANFKKPDSRIFAFAMHLTGAKRTDSIMIGDSLELDVLGAKKFGMDQVFFNPEKINHKYKITHDIENLSQLLKIL